MNYPTTQANTRIEEDADPRKYEVGRRLRFVRTDPDEKHVPCTFRRGDVVIPVERNGCGMGIDCRRESDGHCNMVWPTEVVVCRSQPAAT